MNASASRWRIRRRFIAASAVFFSALLIGQAGLAEPEPEAASLVQAALVEARDPGREFYLRVDCASDKGARRLELFPDGIALWDNRLELFLETGERRELAGILLDGGFSELDAEYGGKIKADRQQAPLRVSCLVEFDADGVRKKSQQYVDGFQSEALNELANTLLDQVAPLADSRGTGISSLAEGLEKLAAEQLSAHGFYLRLLELPADRTDGSVMQIHGNTASIRSYSQGAEIGSPGIVALQQAGIERIANALHSSEIGSLPVNLWSDGQIELEVRLLDQGKTTLAREFMRLTPDSLGEAQERFDQLIGELRKIRSELLERPQGKTDRDS